MKILVTGVAGQLGHDIIKELEGHRITCRGVDRDDFDLTDAAAVRSYILGYMPDAIIHCAAYTAVDRAEDEPRAAAAVNAMGTLNIVEAARAINAAVMYISTDYVFPGDGDAEWQVNDKPWPASIYGLTKLQGEQAVLTNLSRFFIVRTAWVFGLNGSNFVKTMLRLGRERTEVSVVGDQIGSPTYTPDLARLLCDMIVTDKYGIYHATNEGFCSWAEFAAAIMEQAGLNCRVKTISSAEYPAKAKRPANSRLSKSALDAAGFERLPAWQNALSRYLQELADNQ